MGWRLFSIVGAWNLAWWCGKLETNMQKAGRDGDSRTATTVLVTCVTEITEQISADFCNFSVMIVIVDCYTIL